MLRNAQRSENAIAGPTTGLPLSTQEKDKAIAIAMSDEYVAEKLWNAAYLASDHNLTHHLSGVVIKSSFNDTGPNATNTTVTEPPV